MRLRNAWCCRPMNMGACAHTCSNMQATSFKLRMRHRSYSSQSVWRWSSKGAVAPVMHVGVYSDCYVCQQVMEHRGGKDGDTADDSVVVTLVLGADVYDHQAPFNEVRNDSPCLVFW